MKLVLLLGTLLTGLAVGQTTSNKRIFEGTCATVWPTAIQTMVEKEFRPTLVDKDSGLASFSYQGQLIIDSAWGSRKKAEKLLTQFVNVPSYAHGYFGAVIQKLRIDSASLLFTNQEEHCQVTIKLGYSVLAKAVTANVPGWYLADSNFSFENRLFDSMVAGF